MNKFKILIQGKNPEYFLKKLINLNVNLYEVTINKNKLIILVDEVDYKKISKIKTSYDIQVLNLYGFNKLKYLIKKYFIFIIFFCMGILIDIILSNIIFDIEIIHPNQNIKDIVYRRLCQYGISKYKFKVNFKQKENIINDILKNEKDNIEWIEIEEIGTKYIVKVEQRKKNNLVNDCRDRNIVAKKNATIYSISADSGEIVKKKLDYVLKGETIISGIIHNKEDVVSKKCAIGKVIGEVWYSVNIELPTYYSNEYYTNEKKYGFNINLFKRDINLFNKYKKFKVNRIYSFNNSLLPINYNFVQYKEIVLNDYFYDLNNCEKTALEMVDDKIYDKLGDTAQVVSKKVLKKDMKESKIIIEVFVKVLEDITAYEEINEELSGSD